MPGNCRIGVFYINAQPHTEHPSWQSLIDESIFVQESSRELPAGCWSKHLRIDTLKRVRRTVSLHLCHSSPNVAQFSATRNSLSPQCFPQGKVREWEWAPTFLSHVGGCPRCPLPSHPIQNTEVICAAEGLERGWENSNESFELIKGTLLTTSRFILQPTLWNPLGNPPMRCWGHLTCRPLPNWPTGTPNASSTTPTPRQSPVVSSWSVLLWTTNESLCRQLVSTYQKLA